MGKVQRMLRFLCGKTFLLKIKVSVYKSCVKSAIHYGSETWSLGLNEIVILKMNRKRHGEKYVWSEINGQEDNKSCVR